MKIKKVVSVFSVMITSFCFVSEVAFGQAMPPAEVKNVIATPSNREIALDWDQAADEDGVVVGYKIYYGTQAVKSAEDSYPEYVSVSTKTNYTISNLQNGKEYFFALTAIDDEENESETYSKEVSAIPVAESPAVISAVQVSNTEILVTMSKPIKLQGGTSSFYFEEKETGREIPIQDAFAEGEKVHIVFSSDALDFGRNYKIMATSLVEDLSGNPIRSGITDSAEFKAIFFEEIVVEGEKPASSSNITNVTKPESTTAYGSAPSDSVIPLPESTTAYGSAPSDSIIPLDASLLKVDSNLLKTEEMVTLSWQPAPDLDNDIADQILFVQKGMDGWGDGISIGKYASKIEVDVELNQNYQVKIITVDTSGNESKGIQLSFTTNLADTGSSTEVVSLVLLCSFFVVGFFFFRRKTI